MKRLNTNEQATLILLFAFIFGAWFRLMPALLAGFPINDGGMFYTMIRDLQANHYIAPMFTTYNHGFIPYAYPPLGFYVGAFLSDILNISPMVILRWLPGFVNALCIPAFYFFAKEILKDKFQSAVATLVYALIPHLTSWHSMGGGLTRSFGMLFMLITLVYVHRMFEQEDVKNLWKAALFGGLTTLSHPEAPIYTTAIALFIWVMKSRSLKGALNGMLIALGVLLIAGPWYATVLYQHGLEPFKSISQTGAHSFSAILKLFNIHLLTEEPYLGILSVLGVLGVGALVVKNDYFIPLMLVVIFWAQPRSAHIMGNVPLAMAAGFFITEVVLPGLLKLQTNKKALTAFFIIAGLYIFRNSVSYANSLSEWVLPEPERNAMQWVGDHTPEGSKFLVISGDTNAFCDPVNEWFPALSNRRSLTTVQGSEWLLNDGFGNNMIQIQELQACMNDGLECFTRELKNFDGTFDYVYISAAPAVKDCRAPGLSAKIARRFVKELESAGKFLVAYHSEKVVILKNK